jgi:hypothetical protein
MAQPDLDFMAPEVQLEGESVRVGGVTLLADMFSLGLLTCALYTDDGCSLIQAEHNPATYAKQIDSVSNILYSLRNAKRCCLINKIFLALATLILPRNSFYVEKHFVAL